MMPNAIMKTITTLLLALCLFGQAHAMEAFDNSILLKVEAYSVSEGLSQSTVTSIAEDIDGYAWIGTLNGLNKFDGEDFKHYFSSNKENTIPSSFIRSIYKTSNDKLLIGTDRGLVIYNKSLDNFHPIEHFSDLPIWSINEYDSKVYIGTESSIFTLDSDFKIVNYFKYDFGGVKKVIKYRNSIFIKNYDGVVYQLKDNDEVSILSNHSYDILIYNNNLYILKDTGTFEVKGNELKKVTSDRYDSITIEADNLKSIIGHEIYLVNSDFKKTKVGKLDINRTNLVKPTIYMGNHKTYITTQNQGFIVKLDYENLISHLEVVKKNVWSIDHDLIGNLLISTDSNFIKLLNPDYSLIKKYNSGVKGPKRAIFSDENLFVATTNGLLSIDKKSGLVSKIDNSQFFAIHASLGGKTVYAGTLDGVLYKVNSSSGAYSKFEIDHGNPIFDIKYSDETVWVATQGGLFKLQNNEVHRIYSNEIVISLLVDEGGVYFGTESSLMFYDIDNKTTSKIYSNNKPIYSIISDKEKVYTASIKEVAITKKSNLKTITLSDIYGSQDEYNAQAIINTPNSILIGGLSGISKIIKSNLESYLLNIDEPEVNLDNLLIFNIPEPINGEILKSAISSTNKLSLKHSDYPFTIKFNSPGHNSNNISYVYQLSGLSDTWIESKGTNSATYTNLSAGQYAFNIYAVDALTKQPGKLRSILIEITPPWWLSKQAKFIYFMLSLIISAVIVKSILRRREVQNQIAKSEERLKLSLWGSGDEMWDWDIETGQIYRSNIWGSLEFPRDGQRSGETGEESNIHPMDQERVSTALNDHFYGKSDHFEAAYRVKGKSGDWVWILDRAKIVERDEKDNPLRMTGTIKNINNFKHAEEQLRLFERAIANISEGMFILDSEFRFVEVNEACCELCLKPKDKFIGEQFNFDLYPDSYSEQIRTILNQQGRWSNDVESAKGDGSSFLMELTVDAIYDEQGQLTHYVGVFSDISRRKQQEEELRKLTNNDLLTNLPNRSSLMVTLGNLVKRDSHHTLMVLDLDNFKKINDSLGHQVGDELLIKVARRIEAAVPYHTSIYRLGGDEFAILVDDNPDIGSSAVIANGVIEAFVTPFELTSDKVVVGMSIGIVLYPEDDQNEQALLRKADIAMYHAKSAGGNRYQFYSESLNRNAIRQLEVENLIRQGIKEDLFEVYYQPKIDLKSGKMAGMEALVRLNHPEQGLIPPSEFIPLAEENGLIVEIGDIVMKKACFAAQKWRSQGIFNGRVAVNLSSYQFALPDLQQRIESILRLTQLPAANLELEITEGTVIKEPEKAIKVMQQLSKMGVTLALDDFGTGYSSLSYLKRFPIHTLKIDKAFVDDIDKSDRDLKMVDSIITIAHNMGLSVVGEG
ncbi:MAG: EAL domain-containing protein, partial [Shewanella sp.]|nr:EAL domain-containing protein [Shewanella sp.]